MGNLFLKDYRYEDYDTGFSLDDIEDKVHSILIKVVSGDEIAEILYFSGKRIRYDAGELADNCRIIPFYDGGYYLYDYYNKINHIEEFNKRKDSYDLLWELRDESL